ncbi:hypothetical protein FA10DRAFT_286729 [Acaromyces ingoldii]|uniref:Steroid 5-alpha reductase C-terminal domain-containing protein n=1 Tax=Acaromyces ingoldii TaxID=215250 RepID=A0A316YND4_9BASI|nr:hypothetical protein FA10DRAFT_286729 [Acaromyces ingoldii]PWN91060.1 hypothetical protein FA10DRAFT_286729 [Acaromyces ingoldii]
MSAPKNMDKQVAPLDFFPFRGQCGPHNTGGSLFLGVRALVIGSMFPGPVNIPGASEAALGFLTEDVFGFALPYATVAFTGLLLSSAAFALYNLVWRRERLPLKSQGGAIQIATQVNLVDLIHTLALAFSLSRNRSWSPATAQWMPLLFAVGLALHQWADGAKYVVKSTRGNDGKLCTRGVWSLFCGGWYLNGMLALSLVYVFVTTSFPTSERYLATKYKQQWTQYCQQTRSKILPFVY